MNCSKSNNPYHTASVTIADAWQRDVIGRKMCPEAANCRTLVVACSDVNKHALLDNLWANIRAIKLIPYTERGFWWPKYQ